LDVTRNSVQRSPEWSGTENHANSIIDAFTKPLSQKETEKLLRIFVSNGKEWLLESFPSDLKGVAWAMMKAGFMYRIDHRIQSVSTNVNPVIDSPIQATDSFRLYVVDTGLLHEMCCLYERIPPNTFHPYAFHSLVFHQLQDLYRDQRITFDADFTFCINGCKRFIVLDTFNPSDFCDLLAKFVHHYTNEGKHQVFCFYGIIALNGAFYPCSSGLAFLETGAFTNLFPLVKQAANLSTSTNNNNVHVPSLATMCTSVLKESVNLDLTYASKALSDMITVEYFKSFFSEHIKITNPKQ